MNEEKVTTTTNTQSQTPAHGEAPQKVYEQKKAIFRFNLIVWYILGFIEVLLAFRVALKALGANSQSGFTNLIYSLTTPLITPFNGILGVFVSGNSLIEWSSIIAGIVYLCVAWGLAYFLSIIYPISPNDVSTN